MLAQQLTERVSDRIEKVVSYLKAATVYACADGDSYVCRHSAVRAHHSQRRSCDTRHVILLCPIVGVVIRRALRQRQPLYSDRTSPACVYRARDTGYGVIEQYRNAIRRPDRNVPSALGKRRAVDDKSQ